MPERNRSSPYKVMAPFAGLDTLHAPRDISPRHASKAVNVLLDKGTIQPRPPLEIDARFSFAPPGKIYAGVDWYSPNFLNARRNLTTVLHHQSGLLTFGASGGGGGLPAARQGSFVFAAGRLYYMDGIKVFRFDGEHWTIAGIPAPSVPPEPSPENQVIYTLPPPPTGTFAWRILTANMVDLPASAALAFNTVYRFAFTFYDADSDSESNPAYTGEVTTPQPPISNDLLPLPFLGFSWGQPPQQRGVTHARAYVRNVSAGQAFYVLWREFPVWQTEGKNFADPLLGNADSGPFAPVKNGVPEFATVGWYYKNRMFYNDVHDPSLVRFSELGHPGQVDSADWFRLDDDGGQITGMGELAGQLAIVKERSLWVLSGTVGRAKNADIAVGKPLEGFADPELYKTKVTVGCANAAGGNGMIVCSGKAYYNGLDGLYAFDGLIEHNVANHIAPTWREFVGSGTFGHFQAVSYGNDPDRQVLYLVNLSVDNERTKVLAFHYASGAWTTIAPDDPGDNPSCIIQLMGTQDANAPQDPNARPELRPTGLAMAVVRAGTSGFDILVMNDRRTDLPLPACEYESGRLTLIEGRDSHIYSVKWYLNDIEDEGTLPRRLDIGFRTRPRKVDERRSIDLVSSLSAWQKVGEVGSDITVGFRKPLSGDSFWHPDLSVSGFEIDAEPVGQR
jgi:hypothetical protein